MHGDTGGTLTVDAPGTVERDFEVPYITRVEGEGSLRLRVRDGEVVEARLEIFEAPRYFERLVVGRTAGRGPRHRRPHLRHLPDRVPDDRRPRVRGPVRDRDRPVGPGAAPAPLLRRVDPEPRAPRVPPPRAGLPGLPVRARMAADHRDGRGAGADDQEGRQRADRRPRRPPGPSRVRAGGRLLAGAAREGRSTRSGGRSTASCDRRRRPSASWPRWAPPALSHPQPLVAMRHPAEYPLNDGRIVSNDGLDIAPGAWGEPVRGAPGRGHERAAGADPRPARSISSGPTARIALDRGHAAPARGRGAGRDRPRRRASGSTSIARSSRARSSSSTRAPRRATSSTGTARRPSRESRSRRGRGLPRGPRRRRAASSSTGTRSMRRGTSCAPRSCPPTSQNQGAIEADLAAFAPSVLDLPHAEATHRLEMLIRAYDPCISCATHFLDLRIVDAGREEGTG